MNEMQVFKVVTWYITIILGMYIILRDECLKWSHGTSQLYSECISYLETSIILVNI